MTGIYIHVPFCRRKCPYCAFYSGPSDAPLRESYTQALERNIRSFSSAGITAHTVYFGGGTPSTLTPSQISRLLTACQETFTLHDPEVTLEANPCTVDRPYLEALRSAGVDRLSFGVQSLQDPELKALGRLHTASQAIEAVNTAYEAGFRNISADLMLGTPGQTPESLSDTLSQLLTLPLTHISAYMLKVEEDTPFHARGVEPADEDLMCQLYDLTCDTLISAGFDHYEISNFARPGCESRHNTNYWECGEYLGFGPSAHSFFGGTRYFCPDTIRDYTDAPAQTKQITEQSVDPLEEYILLGLRLKKGLSPARLTALSDPDTAHRIIKAADALASHGLMTAAPTLSLTRRGMLVSNAVISELLTAADTDR